MFIAVYLMILRPKSSFMSLLLRVNQSFHRVALEVWLMTSGPVQTDDRRGQKNPHKQQTTPPPPNKPTKAKRAGEHPKIQGLLFVIVKKLQSEVEIVWATHHYLQSHPLC